MDFEKHKDPMGPPPEMAGKPTRRTGSTPIGKRRVAAIVVAALVAVLVGLGFFSTAASTGNDCQSVAVAAAAAAEPSSVDTKAALTPAPVESNGTVWQPVATLDFGIDAAKVREAYGDYVNFYPEGMGEGKYRVDKTTCTVGGMLNINSHIVDGVPAGAAGAFIREKPLVTLDADGNKVTHDPRDFIGGRAEWRAQADLAAGWGVVGQFWSATNNWPDGEMDMETLDLSDGQVAVFHHEVGATPEVNHKHFAVPGASWAQWHDYAIEWLPGKYVKYYVDNVVVVSVDASNPEDAPHIPTAAMRFVIQAASAHQDITEMPADKDGTNIRIDSVKLFVPQSQLDLAG